MKDKVIAIVPAAGIGKRFSDSKNKPFELLGEKPLIIWALEILEGMADIHEIIPVLKESDMNEGVDLFERCTITKVKRIAPGGNERQDSVLNGLNLIDDKKSVVLIHDGVRPFLDTQISRNALAELYDCDGVVVGVPVKDTIKEVKGDTVCRTLRRDRLWSVQTPQIFPFKTLYNAYAMAKKESFYSTDDAALVEKYGGRIKTVMGSYKNIKITTPEDLMIAELFLRLRTETV